MDPRAARQVEALSLTLSKLPVHAPVADVFNAIRPYMPLAAGLFSIIRPSAPDSIVTQGVWLPPQVLESWIGTPDDQLALTLAPVIRSEPGSLWRDRETVTGAFREQLEVLHRLDAAGLGEGAGYKVLQRTSPWHGVEHFLLAMILERGARVPPHAPAVLAALNPALSATILRIGLPLVESIPIFAQITAERLIGYACFSFGGTLLAANGRAHKLVMRFRDAARVERGSGKLVLEEFAARARLFASHGRTWRLDADEPRSLLDVGVHRLSKETHPLPEDVLLLVMHEVFLAEPSADELFGRAGLTSREKEIAFRLVRTSALAKQMAAELSLSEGTVNTHIKHVYRKLGVRSRQELVLLLKK